MKNWIKYQIGNLILVLAGCFSTVSVALCAIMVSGTLTGHPVWQVIIFLLGVMTLLIVGQLFHIALRRYGEYGKEGRAFSFFWFIRKGL